MVVQRDLEVADAVIHMDETQKYESPIDGSTVGSQSGPNSFIAHPMGSVQPSGDDLSQFNNEKDPFDTDSLNWTYGKHLAASLQGGNAAQRVAPSANMSVLFQDLTVVGAGSGAKYQATVGETVLLPLKTLRSLLSARKSPEKTILHGVDGVVRAGQMLLVLGRPGSGCSTLLKSLAGFDEAYVRTEGQIKYNGTDISAIRRHYRGDVVYNAEVEEHFPHLNVRQTLNFAVESRVPGPQRNRKIKSEYTQVNTDMLATTFGLRHTLGTKVGDDFVRGVSGGERKRVSIAETLATKASVCYWDNPTRGLDASTSLEFATTIRSNTTVAHTTAVVAAYQPGNNFTLAFDKVTILYLGRQIFFGTLADAKSHFEGLGFLSKPRQTTADFLTAITDPTGRRVQEGRQHDTPRSPEDFVSAWKSSKFYVQLQHEIAQYKAEFSDADSELMKFNNRKSSQLSKRQRLGSAYTSTILGQLIGTLKRSYQRVWGDKVYLFANVFAAVFMSLINGSVFVNTPENTSGFFSKGGIIFFAILFNALQTLSEVSNQYAQRPIVQKQKGFAMYHPFIDSLASILADYPVKFLSLLLFDIVIYFMVGLKGEVGAFFIFVLFTYTATIAMSGLFRTVAAATKRPETASAIAGVFVLIMTIYTGYIIPVPSMHPWFSWFRHINPIAYGFEALMVNEFHGQNGECVNLVPSGPGYENISTANQVCAVTGAISGLSYVNGDDYLLASFGYEYSHLWRNYGILVGFVVFFVFTCAVATEFNPPPPGQGEFLVFRKGHEPEHVKRALEAGKAVDDVEHGMDAEILTGIKTNVSEFHGLVKSKDIFVWEHVNYDIKLSSGEKRRLLNDVSGYVKPGTLTALMGESGAGKTTLLNVLAQRVDSGVVGGDMSVNDQPLPRSYQHRTGYVQQQDLHIAESTVREALRFSALLRQPADVPLQDKYDYVERVIGMLEMEEYAEAVIGSPGNGLNVEQRKRTTIGTELVAKPALLLFLDEPTSGLDSQSAWSIVRLLRKLANSGQAILCTIHQPSSVLFEQFDRLLLLEKGGRTVYFGKIGQNSEDVIHYFGQNGAFECHPDENPAEYVLQVIGAGATARIDRDWGDVWNGTQDAADVPREIKALKEQYQDSSDSSIRDEHVDGAFAASWLTQYKAVQQRVFQIYWRNPDYVVSKIFLEVVAGLFLGFTFYQEDMSVQGMQNKLFAIFMSTILAVPLMNQLQPKWEALASLYSVREKPSKIYHWTTFVLSNILAEIPYNIVAGTLFFIGWYFGVGFSEPFSGSIANNRGIYEWLMIMVFQLWWSTFGQALSALTPNAQTAATLTTLFATFVITFNGVLQPLRALIQFWHWMYYLSPFTWLIAGLASNVISGAPTVCSSTELNIFNPPAGQTCQEFAGPFLAAAGTLLNPDAVEGCEYCRYSDGDQYLSTLNMSFDDRWRNLGLVCAYVVFNAALAFCFFYLTKVVKLDMTKISISRTKKISAVKEKSSPNLESEEREA